MKTKVIAILAMLMFTMTFTHAQDPQTSLKQTITTKIQYPVSAVENNIEGTVFVQFKVTGDGTINVIECKSSQTELQSYVYKELSNITITPDTVLTDKNFVMHFDFKLL